MSQQAGGYTGIDVLARKPDAQVMIVSDTSLPKAIEMFPGIAVIGWNHLGIPKPEMLAGRDVVTWLGYGHDAELADSLVGVAARVRVVNGQHSWMSFLSNPKAAVQYARTNLQPVAPRAGVEPAIALPEAPAAVVARPAASVTSIVEARTRQQAKVAPEPGVDFAPLSDDALAAAFTAAHPELRYVARWGKWLEWDGAAGWVEDSTLHVYDLARRLCATVAESYRGVATPASVSSAKSAGKRAAVENLARSDRAHAASADQWDADPMLLNTPGGVVDLTTGAVRAVRMDDYCLKMTAATPVEGCPKWLEFLKFGTNGDAELIGFLQRWAGLNLTGQTREQKFVFIHGRGGSGKGTFLNTIARILGTYAKTIAMETLTESHNEKHPEELARLAGVRMATAAETQQGKRWAEARIKALTGEDTITARFMHQNSFEYRPQLKLTIMGNHPPGLRSVDASMRRRLLIVPFDHIPPTPDPHLADALWAERDGILFWMLCGAIAWQCDGLAPPPAVITASDDYFDNQDITGQWIQGCCETGTGCNSPIRALYKSYVAFIEPSGYQPLRQGELRDALLSRGFTMGGYKTAPTIVGIRVRPGESAPGLPYQD